jgi:hypothetical protein
LLSCFLKNANVGGQGYIYVVWAFKTNV